MGKKRRNKKASQHVLEQQARADPTRPFFGETMARKRRKKLEGFHFLVEKWVEEGRMDSIERWMTFIKTSTDSAFVSWGFCETEKIKVPFYYDYCLSCLKRERSIPTMERPGDDEKIIKNIEEMTPMVFFGRAQANGECLLHPQMPKQDLVLSIHMGPGKDPVIACVICARKILTLLMRDYYRETRNRQDPKDARVFWGSESITREEAA